MKSQFQPWQLLLLILAGWMNRRQQDAIEYLMTENRVLREKLGKKRIPLNDDQRRRLAIKGKILERMIFFGERSLQVAVSEFLSHFHAERNHQGLGNRLIKPGEEVGRTAGEVACRERLGGMLRYYYRQAA